MNLLCNRSVIPIYLQLGDSKLVGYKAATNPKLKKKNTNTCLWKKTVITIPVLITAPVILSLHMSMAIVILSKKATETHRLKWD